MTSLRFVRFVRFVTFVAFACVLGMTLLLETSLQAQETAKLDRFAGKWQGSWLEGMSSGKVFLDLGASAGQEAKIELTSFPKFGPGVAPVRDIAAENETLKFSTPRSDGKEIKFELTLNQAGNKLKGKARYEGSRVEVELARPE
jgi:hypothetical protein